MSVEDRADRLVTALGKWLRSGTVSTMAYDPETGHPTKEAYIAKCRAALVAAFVALVEGDQK